jgi:hypothetical protein
MERLVAGRERIYLDRFWTEFSANSERFSEAARTHYSKLYAMPGATHSVFMQFAAFDQDAIDNQKFLAKGKLPMPVLARRRKIIWCDHGKDHALCGQQRARRCNSRLWPLDHGGKPDRNDLHGASVPRCKYVDCAAIDGAGRSGLLHGFLTDLPCGAVATPVNVFLLARCCRGVPAIGSGAKPTQGKSGSGVIAVLDDFNHRYFTSVRPIWPTGRFPR